MPASILTLAPAEAGRARWVVEAAAARGLSLAGIDVPGDRYYWGGPAWAAANADRLGVALLEPDDTWLSSLSVRWLSRSVQLTTLEAVRMTGKAFVKPPSSKDFPARVYDDLADLRSTTCELSPATAALVSDPVEFAAEYRLFVLDGRVHTGSRYATYGNLDPGTLLSAEARRVVDFVEELLTEVGDTLPSAVVIDAGLVGPGDDPRRDVAVVEANMAWFAQPYWSEPSLVLDVVTRAAGPAHEVAARDGRFVRRI